MLFLRCWLFWDRAQSMLIFGLEVQYSLNDVKTFSLFLNGCDIMFCLHVHTRVWILIYFYFTFAFVVMQTKNKQWPYIYFQSAIKSNHNSKLIAAGPHGPPSFLEIHRLYGKFFTSTRFTDIGNSKPHPLKSVLSKECLHVGKYMYEVVIFCLNTEGAGVITCRGQHRPALITDTGRIGHWIWVFLDNLYLNEEVKWKVWSWNESVEVLLLNGNWSDFQFHTIL